MKRTSIHGTVGATLAGLLCLASIATAFPIPSAPPTDATPVSPRYQIRQHHFLEAAGKAMEMAKEVTAGAEETPNMALWDAVHYDLDLTLDTVAHQLTGTVTTTGRVLAASLDEVDQHLYASLLVTAATSAGLPAAFQRPGHIVVVPLDRTYLSGETFEISVTYTGFPSGNGFWWDSHDGQPWVYTLSEPYRARRWWPCKDLNIDKADSVDIRVTVPDGLIVASNGLLVSEIDNGDTRTFHWHESYPIATYLVSLAAHPFATFSDWYHYSETDSMELQHFVLPSELAAAEAGFPVTVDMMHVFADGFGEYPFIEEKYGHAHFDWGGGMEHQTLTSLVDGIYGEWIIAHELAHQWWGDLITCTDFGHIWLNEGFATWSEAYWREINEGIEAYHEEMAATEYFGPGTIFVEEPDEFGDIFNVWLSYYKSSWVVHMLRHILGDADFFASLHSYRATYEFSSATTEQFRDICEAVSGLDLDLFFEQWIYGEYNPEYVYSWYTQPSGGSTLVHLGIEQVQQYTGPFSLPLDVRVTTDEDVFDFVVQNEDQLQVYSLAVSGQVLTVELDPDKWVLSEIQEVTVDVPAQGLTRARLLPNRPNPFNPSTRLEFELPASAGPVTLQIFDMSGRLVRTVLTGDLPPGLHSVDWNGRDDAGRAVGSGSYFLRLQTDLYQDSRKISLIK